MDIPTPLEVSMARRRPSTPVEVEILDLARKGCGLGVLEDGHSIQVRHAPPGSRVRVQLGGRKKGVYKGHRLALIRPPSGYTTPACKVFGLCGGCALQELTPEAQRAAKWQFALSEVAKPMGISVADLVAQCGDISLRAAEEGYRYRNKVELSFGTRQYLSKADLDGGEPLDGRFLGFHAPGRFDRIVDTDHCWLVSESANQLLQVVRSEALSPDSPPPYNPHSHEGFFRHLMIRQGTETGEMMLVLYTQEGDAHHEEWIDTLASRLFSETLPSPNKLVSFLWVENNSVADVAQGVVRRVWGESHFSEQLGHLKFSLSHDGFFQTSTKGALVLYETVAEALSGVSSETLLDLYCGAGTIGLFLSDRFKHVVGVEVVESAVKDGEKSAAQNNISNMSFQLGAVESVIHEVLEQAKGAVMVVDPPRAGLHPKAVAAIASAAGSRLVYVACNPGSLGRDGVILQQGGWVLTGMWVVDLFPQTGHVEVVAQFDRPSV